MTDTSIITNAIFNNIMGQTIVLCCVIIFLGLLLITVVKCVLDTLIDTIESNTRAKNAILNELKQLNASNASKSVNTSEDKENSEGF